MSFSMRSINYWLTCEMTVTDSGHLAAAGQGTDRRDYAEIPDRHSPDRERAVRHPHERQDIRGVGPCHNPGKLAVTGELSDHPVQWAKGCAEVVAWTDKHGIRTLPPAKARLAASRGLDGYRV